MIRTILTTVGTSLLTNADRPWAGWRPKQPQPDPATVDSWLQSADPIKASAEAHTWYRLGLFDADRNDKVEVRLIHSQTAEGQFCAARLVALARARGMKGEVRQVDGLSYTDGHDFTRGLRRLAHVVGEEVRRGQLSGTVELAATGGFKAEIAIANLVGAVSDTPVHYIYEQFTSLITIEPIPVTLRADWIGSGAGRTLLDHFGSADGLVPLGTIEPLLKQDERLRTLIDVDGADAALNLLGEIALRLLDSPHDAWPPPTDAPPADKIRLDSAAHHRPRGWEQVVETIARSRFVTSIRYEGSSAGGNLQDAPDNTSDLIHRIGGSPALTLRISTTATSSGQRRLVQGLLRRELKS